MAMLVACGNAICGNSAIAAVAPVINAESDDIATSIAFTAVLGIVVVIALPVAAHHLHLSPYAGGALVGLTVYAVPQVVAMAGLGLGVDLRSVMSAGPRIIAVVILYLLALIILAAITLKTIGLA